MECIIFYSFLYTILLCSVKLYKVIYNPIENLIISIEYIVLRSFLYTIILYYVELSILV